MDLTNKKILVTGSNGFIGKKLISRLKRTKSNVIELNSTIDIRKWDDVKRMIKRVKNADIAFHLAAVTFVPFAWENPRLTYETNILGTLNILELCRLSRIKKMIFISSYVYGKPKYFPIDEKHPLEPSGPYAKSKLMAEELCRIYYEDYGIKIIILRPFNIFGEGQDLRFLISSIIEQVLRKKKIELKNPLPKRDFLYVWDFVDACIKAASNEDLQFETFNIGIGKSYSVKEIVEKVLKISGKKLKANYLNKPRPDEIMNIVCDIRKAKKKVRLVSEV